jgi:hypothetical protein
MARRCHELGSNQMLLNRCARHWRDRQKRNRRSGPEVYGDVAQLEEHLLCKQGVVGSSPIISTTNTNALLSRGADVPSLG